MIVFLLYIFESAEISLTFTDDYATVLLTINLLDDFLWIFIIFIIYKIVILSKFFFSSAWFYVMMFIHHNTSINIIKFFLIKILCNFLITIAISLFSIIFFFKVLHKFHINFLIFIIFLSMYLISIYLYIYKSISIYINQSIYLSIYLYPYLSI